jgi:hypothetical protein
LPKSTSYQQIVLEKMMSNLGFQEIQEFSVLFLLFLIRKISKNYSILAQIFVENNADSVYIRFVFLILILKNFTHKIAKTALNFAQIFRENNAKFE